MRSEKLGIRRCKTAMDDGPRNPSKHCIHTRPVYPPLRSLLRWSSRLHRDQRLLPFQGQTRLTRQRGESLRSIAFDANDSRFPRLSGHTLELHMLSLRLALFLLLGIRLDTIQKLLTAFRVMNMLDTNVHSLLHVPAIHDFVADHTDSSSSHIVDDTGFPVVDCVNGSTGKKRA